MSQDLLLSSFESLMSSCCLASSFSANLAKRRLGLKQKSSFSPHAELL
jgi:hypothetical protein